MGDIKHFTDLEAWKVNHEVVLLVYTMTKNFPKDERFGMIDQLRRAASSITANIAEGWGRFHYADRMRFYYQARGSNSEVQDFLILARDLDYCNEREFHKVMEQVQRGFLVINGLIRSIEKKIS